MCVLNGDKMNDKLVYSFDKSVSFCKGSEVFCGCVCGSADVCVVLLIVCMVVLIVCIVLKSGACFENRA